MFKPHAGNYRELAEGTEQWGNMGEPEEVENKPYSYILDRLQGSVGTQ